MSKELIIITLIALAVYFAYQQNNNLPALSENLTQIKNLQQEVQHYQTLYQKRVEKDLEADQSAKIGELIRNIQELEKEKELLTSELTQLKRENQQKETDLSTIKTSNQELKKDLEAVNKDITQKKDEISAKHRIIIGLNESYEKLERKFKLKNKNLLTKLDSYLKK